MSTPGQDVARTLRKKSRISSARKREERRNGLPRRFSFEAALEKLKAAPVAAADDRREGLNTENLAAWLMIRNAFEVISGSYIPRGVRRLRCQHGPHHAKTSIPIFRADSRFLSQTRGDTCARFSSSV